MMLCTKVDQDNFDYKQNTVPLQSLTGNMSLNPLAKRVNQMSSGNKNI
jgi:hypothetical protein